MTVETGRFTLDGVSRTAEALGYRYTDLASASLVGGRETPVFEGTLGFLSLTSGISLCTGDLTSLYDGEHRGTAERCLGIAIVVNGDGANCSFGLDKPTFIGRNCAAIISVADSAPIAGQYRVGQRWRSLLVRTRPEDIADEAVAERIAALLRSTSVSPLPVSHRIMLLAEELAAPTSDGVVGRLLAESCAFELLARALQALGERPEASAPTLSRRDRAKVQLVRDMMLANPEASFTLQEFAREAGMSITVLKAKFSAVFGQSVFSFLRELRLRHAKEGLEKEGWTVSQAAHFVGYRHHSNFSTAFRRRYGVPPKQFRRS